MATALAFAFFAGMSTAALAAGGGKVVKAEPWFDKNWKPGDFELVE